MGHEGHIRYRVGGVGDPVVVAVGSAPRVHSGRRMRRLVWWGSGGYLAILGVLWVALATAPVECWPVCLFLFGPRWLAAVPLLVLVPLAAWRGRRALGVLALAGLIVFFPIMGFNVPIRRVVLGGGGGGQRIRVLTCNTGAGLYDPVRLRALIAEVEPDVVAFQEWGPGDPRSVLPPGEWHHAGAFTLCVASRFPIVASGGFQPAEEPIRSQALRVALAAPAGTIELITVYMITPRDGLEPILAQKWAGVPAFQEICAEQWHDADVVSRWAAERSGPTLVVGDCNVPVESPIYRGTWARFGNAFTQAGIGFGPTRFTRRLGVRIDHVLFSAGWRAARCWVGPDVGSDHRPVLADLVWSG